MGPPVLSVGPRSFGVVVAHAPPLEARERLAALLGAVETPGSFSSKRTAPPADLTLEVRGVGPIRYPVPKAQARQLISIARPARYGLGEQTLLDTRVRDTWEVPKTRVKIDQRRWNKTLLPMLDGLRADLGLPAGCRFKAELHSMLVYARGQFFVPHQDSEKADGMVGSLVVTLPGAFTGGALVVDQGGERATYRSSKDRLSLVAFYADCRHEIRPVRTGYRLVVTYNLVLLGETTATAAPTVAPETVGALAASLDEHFTTPVPAPAWRRAGANGDPPNRLVYLLDHEYTPRALSWDCLKGSDAARVAAICAAADRADCEAVLALADVHETWSAFEDDYDRPWNGGSRYRSWADDDEDEDEDAYDDRWPEDAGRGDDYEVGELIESDIVLEHWIDGTRSPAERISSCVCGSEVCATTPSESLRPYASEYEPYMGNYGNTLDRWYRRGAVVLWPRRRAFEVRAEASPAWALGEVAGRVKTGKVDEARELVHRLAPFWEAGAGASDDRGLLRRTLRVAAGIDEPAHAATLLAPFRLEMLAQSHASDLVALGSRYGERWLHGVVAVWSGHGQRRGDSADRAAWVASLPVIAAALQVAGDEGPRVARLLVGEAWRWLAEAVERRRQIVVPSGRAQALEALVRPTLAVLESFAVIGAADLRDQALGLLGRDDDDDDMLLPYLMAVLRAGAKLAAAGRQAAGIDAIAQHCAGRLESRLSRPPRAENDWSVDLPEGCRCELCETLAAFLADPTERGLEWPLAEQRRCHVHGRIDAAELAVRHQTRRTGRPYTLVLTKTADIFEREAASRRRDEADLSWLQARGVL